MTPLAQLPTPEPPGLREALTEIAGARRERSECPDPATCMYPQHHSDDESYGEFATRLQRVARAALEAAQPATPEPPLDVERLARALCSPHSDGPHREDGHQRGEGHRAEAARVAIEYAALAESKPS
jgi:N-acetyl-beta-hexosaminidase